MDEKREYFRIKGGEKDLILLPGLSFFPLTHFKDFIKSRYDALLDEHTIHVFDSPISPDDAYSLENECENIMAMLRKLKIRKFDALGISKGGMLAQILACNSNSAANHLILCSTTAKVDRKSRRILLNWRNLCLRKDYLGLAESFCSLIYTPAFAASAMKTFEDNIKNAPDCYSKRFAKLIDGCKNFDGARNLNGITAKTTCISSLGDKVIDQKIANGLFSECENISFITYPETSSHALYDEEDDFVETVKRELIK